MYVYSFTTGSVRSDLITVRSEFGNPSPGKLWYFWIVAIADAKCSWNHVSVVDLLNRGSPVGWTCWRSRNCRWRVKANFVIVTFNCSLGVSVVHGQKRKTGLKLSYSKKYQCWLASFPSSRGNIQIFVRLIVPNLPKFYDCQDKGWVPGVEIGRGSAGNIAKIRCLLSFPKGRISIAECFVNFKQCNQQPKGGRVSNRTSTIKSRKWLMESWFNRPKKNNLYAKSNGPAYLTSSNSMNYFWRWFLCRLEWKMLW